MTRILHRLGLSAAAVYLLLVLVAAVFPALFTAADPLAVDVSQRLTAPSAEHIFGTDQSGRDVYARVIYGTSISVGVAVLATAWALVIGVVLGTLLGLAPRIVDVVAMRVLDVFLAIPEFLIALVIVAAIGPSAANVALAVTLAAIPVYVRYARSHTLALKREEYVEAARVLGVGRARVAATHIVPGVIRRLSVLATLGLGTSILAVSGLSFLGLGVGEPTPEWGLILSEGRNVLRNAPWVSLFPGIAITLTVVAASALGRAARKRSEGGAA